MSGAIPTNFNNSTVRYSIAPAFARFSMSSRGCRSSNTKSMPARCSRCAATSPAGPAPTIATVVSASRPLLTGRRVQPDFGTVAVRSSTPRRNQVETIRLTTAQAIVRWLVNQYTVIDGTEQPLFAGVSAIFGHGNVTCLGEALEPVRDVLPTWHGHNEQAMALTGVAFAKAKRRRQIMIATSASCLEFINMVRAAALAHATRLPLLLLSGDTFLHRIVDPVLQQIEQFDDPT